MIKNLLFSFVVLVSAPAAFAQEFGALLGVHQTSADSSTSGTSIDGGFNFKAGMLVGFELAESLRFRSGLLYNQRHTESSTGGVKSDVKFDYLDIPALGQYNVNEMFGFVGGLVVAANVNDEVKSGSTKVDADVKTLIPLLNVGVNLMFQDMIGFDVYYERGLGTIAKGMENYGTFGANFLYWF